MTLDDLLLTVASSNLEEWHKMDLQTVYNWTYGQSPEGNFLEPRTFDTLAVYKPDIDISLAFAATIRQPFEEPWVKKFPNPRAESVSIVLRYRGTPVYEWVGVIVDGCRYLLPMPKWTADGEMTVKQAAMPMARRLFDLFTSGGVHETLDTALARAGIAVVA